MSFWLEVLASTTWTEDECALLTGLARRLPARPIIVNIGAGISTPLVRMVRADAALFSIDIRAHALKVERKLFERLGLGPAGRGGGRMAQTKTAYELSDWLGYLSHLEIDLLKDLARALPPESLAVNIGAGCGTGALALLESRPDLRVVTVDIQREASPLGCLAGERVELEKSGIAFEGRYSQIHGDSKLVLWDRPPANMVFVDGDHTYEGCRGDILAWLPRIVPGGVLALHDYRKPAGDKPHPGVDRAVDELLLGRYENAGRAGTLIAFRVPR